MKTPAKNTIRLIRLKLEYPCFREGLISYINFPSQYMLSKRLDLSDSEQLIIIEAWDTYQKTVASVLKDKHDRLMRQAKTASGNRI